MDDRQTRAPSQLRNYTSPEADAEQVASYLKDNVGRIGLEPVLLNIEDPSFGSHVAEAIEAHCINTLDGREFGVIIVDIDKIKRENVGPDSLEDFMVGAFNKYADKYSPVQAKRPEYMPYDLVEDYNLFIGKHSLPPLILLITGFDKQSLGTETDNLFFPIRSYFNATATGVVPHVAVAIISPIGGRLNSHPLRTPFNIGIQATYCESPGTTSIE